MASTVVDVVGLAAARLPELKRLLDDSSDGLPVRHLRRRATAHDRRHRGRPKLNKPPIVDNAEPLNPSPLAAAPQGQAGHLSRKQRRRPAALYALHNPHAAEEASLGEAAMIQITSSSATSVKNKATSHCNVSQVRWLETHIWFAKRCRMVQRDGWALPEHRSDRGCSAAVDASRHGCVAFDATATQPLEVCGCSLGQVASLLARLGDPSSLLALAGGLGSDLNSNASSGTGEAEKKNGKANADSFGPLLAILRGQREGNTWIHAPDAFPRGLLGPARLLLDPAGGSHDQDEVSSPSATTAEAVPEPGAAAQCAALMQSPAPRRLWLWCHPATRADVATALNTVLRELDNRETSSKVEEVAMSVGAPRGGGVVRFELRGPSSAATLARIGVAVPRSIGESGSSGPVSDGDLWASNVADPRGLRFAPGDNAAAAHKVGTTKNVKRKGKARKAESESEAGDGRDGDGVGALMQFWSDRSAATRAATALPDHVLNEQRRQAAAASIKGHSSNSKSSASHDGEASAITSEVLVPVVAVARLTLDQWSNHKHHHHHSKDAATSVAKKAAALVHRGWDLVVPAGWGRAFWVALTMAGAHAGGEDERHAVLSASGQPHFPTDFPDSFAGAEYWQPPSAFCGSMDSKDGGVNRAANTSAFVAPAWQPKSKAKGRALPPHACNSAINWLALFSAPSSSATPRALGASAAESKAAPAGATAAVGGGALGAATSAAAKLLVARECRYVMPLFKAPLPAVPRPTLLTVTLMMITSGVPHAGATIHLIASTPQAVSSAAGTAGDTVMSSDDEEEVAPTVSNNKGLGPFVSNQTPLNGAAAVGVAIGRVTSGAYAKHLGKGCGVGLCTVSGLQRASLAQLSSFFSPPCNGEEGSLQGIPYYNLLRIGALRVAVIAAPTAETPRCINTAAAAAAAGAKAKTSLDPSERPLRKVHEATLSLWIEGS